MTISYTALLGLAQPVTGTETGQWGTVVNDEITALLEDAVANAASISVTAGNVTLSTTNGSSNQARMSTLIITGTPGTTRNVVAPSQAKIYVVINQSDGAVVIKGAATSGVTIGAGQTAQVAWNGSDFVEIGNYVHGNFVVNGNLSVNGDSTLGNAGADTTTINGQVIAANSNISKTTTLSASAPALAWIKGATYTDTGTAGGTTQALAPFTVFSAPTLSTSNIVTYTNAATVYVAGAPAAAGSATITNPYSLYVAAGDAYFGASVSATTLDLTNLEVTNIKAKDGTASMTLADSTGVVTFSANPVLNAGTANGVPYLSSPGKVLTTGSALTFDGTNLVNTSSSVGTPEIAIANSATSAGANARLRIKTGGSGSTTYGDAFIQFTDSLNWNWSIGAGSSTSNNLTFNQYFGLTSNELMRLTSTGLGIGTNNPGAKLNVQATGIQGLFQYDASNQILVFHSGSNGYVGTLTNQPLILRTNNTDRATLDTSGNLGLGVTPSAWTAYKVLQINTGSYASSGNNAFVGSNWFYDGADKYIASDYATLYRQYLGAHAWFTAPSGTADGTAATSLTSAQNGNSYTIKVAGTTDFTLIGAANNNVGTVFTKSGGTGAGTGTVSQNISFTQAMTLHASGGLSVGNTTDPGVGSAIISGNITSSTGDITVGTAGKFLYSNYVAQNSGNSLYLRGATASGQIEFQTNTTTKATLDSSGNLGLGVTPSAWGGVKALQVGSGAALYDFGSANVALGSNVYFNGTDNKYISSDYATYYQQNNGVHIWATAPSGNAGDPITFTQAMTLDASGDLAIGTTTGSIFATGGVNVSVSNPSGIATIAIGGSTGNSGYLELGQGSVRGALIEGSTNTMIFYTNGTGSGTSVTERARITSGGDLLVQATSSSVTSDVGHKIRPDAAAPFMGTVGSSSSGADVTYSLYSTGAAAYRFYVGYNGTISATTTTITGISDVRLKENIRDLNDGLAAVMALKPRKFDWKEGKGKDIKDDRGFIAQEFEQVFPDLIEEWKDPAPEGEEPYKAVNANLIPTLVKAIQEQQAMINELKAEVAALKGA